MYTFDLEGMGDTFEKVEVDEIDVAIKAGNGTRNPTNAGIRLGNQKYMYVSHDESDKTTQLSKRGGGGGAIAITNKAFIVAFYEKDLKQSDGQNQNGGDCEMQVLAMAKFLKQNYL